MTIKVYDTNVRDGFFFGNVKFNNTIYDIALCTNNDGTVNFNDCGHDWGIAGDINKPFADVIDKDGDGYDKVLDLLKKAWDDYNA